MEAKEIKRLAQGRWAGIVASLAPHFAKAIGKEGRHCGCPVHGGTDGFRVFKDFDCTGGGVCNSCGIFNDGYSLLMWANGWDFATTHRAIQDTLVVGGARKYMPPPVRNEVKSSEDDVNDIRDSLNHVWKSAIPLTHQDAWPARKYFEQRGIAGIDYRKLDSRIIRFVPMLEYYEGQKKVGMFPAIVTLMCDLAGRPATIHRTYITHDGQKAPVASPKKMMRHCAADLFGAMRLTQSNGRVLAVTEGMETALAVMVKFNVPVWAAGNAHLLEHFVPPQGVDVVIYADKDRPSKLHPEGHGLYAARSLLKRLWQEGIKASIKLPAADIPQGMKSVDWLDVVNGSVHQQPTKKLPHDKGRFFPHRNCSFGN